ncbi:hypothetical protein L207DRAFT_531807 [Hyaloscypha variabilis F]|uniref:Rhodopsin domain-containing protein n=1 Tax=Hyaloscypha variabilis (strain UAMH 11265 / GT02V1 / F) TaxID=1149755 RepID=A0A2J6RG68_HYAVF|nr:hypothetical protein L207DRAFT_531807 [Hyaloscypha variabilis F]
MSSNDVLSSESRVAGVLAGTIVPTVFSTIFVLARLYTRSIITKNWGSDDTLITISWLRICCPGRPFRKVWNRTSLFLQILPDVRATLKLAFVSRVVYQFVICTTKLGICTFYLRVFQDKGSKMLIYSLLGFIITTALVIELAFIFACKPVAGAWAIPQTCASPFASFYANTITSVMADVALMVFVIPRVLPLQMAPKQKIILLCVVSLGVLIIIAAYIRLDRIVKLNESNDASWDASDVTTWTSLEVSIGLFCASAPTIRPLIRQIAPNLLVSISQTLSGTSRRQGTKYETGKKNGYVTGTAKFGSRRAEAFELKSRDEGEFGERTEGQPREGSTFWVRSNSDEESRASGDGDIMKTVRLLRPSLHIELSFMLCPTARAFDMLLSGEEARYWYGEVLARVSEIVVRGCWHMSYEFCQ